MRSDLAERVTRLEKQVIEMNIKLGNALTHRDFLKGALWLSWALNSVAIYYVTRHL